MEKATHKVATISLVARRKPALVPMQKRVAEGVAKFFEEKKAETDLYETYQEWYKDLSDRMPDDIPLIYEDFILVKYSQTYSKSNEISLYYWDIPKDVTTWEEKSIQEKRENEFEKATGFKIKKCNEGDWLEKTRFLGILHPKHANDIVITSERCDKDEYSYWTSKTPEGCQREENRNGETFYSMIAFASNEEPKIMEGVTKFLQERKAVTNFFKSYQDWYEDLSDRMTDDIPLIYKDIILVKYSQKGYASDEISLYYDTNRTKEFKKKGGDWLEKTKSVWILHPYHLNDIVITTQREKEGYSYWTSKTPEECQRREIRNGETFYSMIAFASKTFLQSPSYREPKIMEGITKFLQEGKAVTNFFKSYQEWYEFLSDRMTEDIPFIYEDFMLVKQSQKSCSVRSDLLDKEVKQYNKGWILHPTKADDVLQILGN
uniref:Uncharacterized protein n=1 Tax=Clytia hemisphaerica TaxID=252671 RepID=A0A7M5V124_9CNID